MAEIRIHQEKVTDAAGLVELCPFGAIEDNGGKIAISAGCRMCRLCVRKAPEVFEFVDDSTFAVDKSAWRGIAVVAETDVHGTLHPVGLELLGKAKELAAKISHPVLAVVIGHGVEDAAKELLAYGADEVYVYDDPAFKDFRIEPYANALEDFIEMARPSSVLVGGTVNGRSLAPRVATRFRSGLTADCTVIDVSPNTDLDQIRPAYGGNIMAHINTPKHRPQFATVRYKVFSPPSPGVADGKLVRRQLPEQKLVSKIEILARRPKEASRSIEEAEVLVVCGRGVRRREDISLLEELAGRLGGMVAGTRAVIEAGWLDAKRQIGLSGRSVKPKLIITCGVSGAIQFVAGMSGSECVVAVNSDPKASIFKVAHIALVGDLYTIVPQLLAKIDERNAKEG